MSESLDPKPAVSKTSETPVIVPLLDATAPRSPVERLAPSREDSPRDASPEAPRRRRRVLRSRRRTKTTSRAERYSETNPRRVRTLFVSDVHLGAKHTQADQFLDYLRCTEPEHLYLVGDFLDGRKLRSKWRWNAVYTQIFERLSELLERGTHIYYTPGNHDDFLRNPLFADLFRGRFGKIEIEDSFHFEAADGSRFLVTHGDRFDAVETGAVWLSHFGGWVYDSLLSINRIANRIRPDFHSRTPYGLCSHVKGLVKKGVRFMSNFETRLFTHARDENCQGLICGHVHTPGETIRDGIRYINIGDWVEHCTALVETEEEGLRLEWFYPRAEKKAVRRSHKRAKKRAKKRAAVALKRGSHASVPKGYHSETTFR